MATAEAELKADKPPADRKRAPSRRDYRAENARRTPRNRTASRKVSLAPQLTMYLKLAAGVISTRDQVCGPTLDRQAAAIAKALDTYANENPAAYRWLEQMLSAGGPGGLAVALAPVGMAVVNHHILPAIGRRRGLVMEEATPEEESFEGIRAADEERINAGVNPSEYPEFESSEMPTMRTDGGYNTP